MPQFDNKSTNWAAVTLGFLMIVQTITLAFWLGQLDARVAALKETVSVLVGNQLNKTTGR